MSSTRRFVIALGAVCVGAFMIVSLAGERSFVVTPDPGYVLIELSYHGGLTGMNNAHKLYADGRLVSRRVSFNGNVRATKEYQLDAPTVDGLIKTMVEAGLYESNQALLEERMGPRRRTISASDSPEMRLSIGLSRYQPSDDAKPRDVRTTFTSLHPFAIGEYFRDVEEIQCFEALAHFFRDYPATERRR